MVSFGYAWRPVAAGILMAGAIGLSPDFPATAQTTPPQKAVRPSAPAAKAPGDQTSDAGRPSYDQLRQRVDQLEEQILDMQVVMGTLESLAKGGGTPSPAVRTSAAPVGLGGSDSARIDALETQIRALTAQLEQLSDQLRAIEARRPGAGGAAAAPAPALAAPRGPAPTGFGATIVAPAGSEAVSRGGALEENAVVASAPLEYGTQEGEGAGGNPKQAYETAYGYLLQQNYPAAEGAFDDFLRRYPNDPLAGNAQYWLGESYFVRGQFKAAASAFLKGYQTYSRSAKAPDSLLKLAMSLDRLGQKEAACSSFNELGTRFPNAPANVKSRAQSERQRVGC
jgi:tol-pal system protein YbgF